ncbi:hypothetical protein D3C76_1443170 [compost metagenome]
MGLPHLTQPVVGNADHRNLGDRLVFHEQALQLRRVAVEAADDEHVLEPISDAQVSALVEHTDVPGVQPTLCIDSLGGGLGVVEVALH